MVLMNLYNNALLARHPLLRPLADNVRLPRPAVRIWADASGKGYGAHLGPAEQPIALFQQERLTTLPSPDGEKPFELQTDHVYVHEAVAVYLSLDHFRPLLRGATVVAYTDNMIVEAAFRKIRPRGLKEDVLAIVDAVKRLVTAEEIDLEVKLVEGKYNGLADALSRFAPSDSPKYPDIIKSLRKNHLEGSETAVTLIEKIAAASLIHQYAQDEGKSDSVPQNKLDQKLSTMGTGTSDASSWEAVEEDVPPTEMMRAMPTTSDPSDVNEIPDTDGFEQAELPTVPPPAGSDPLFRAMSKVQVAKDKKVKVKVRAIKTAKVKAVKPVVANGGKVKEAKEEAVMTPSKEEEASPMTTSTKETKTPKTLSNTSGPALIEAAESLIKQAQELVKAAQELVKAAKKLVKAAGKKK
jgi:hypothetical protein